MFSLIDQLLRGSFTKREDLAAGRVEVPVRTLVTAAVLMGALYGAFMGLYGVLRPENASAMQVLGSALKVPLLFLLTLIVTFPSLYVFSALSNSTLRAPNTLRLLLVAITANLTILASFGPVTGFFTLSTDSYPFMVLLNVAFFTVGGFVGLNFLRKSMMWILETPMVRAAQPAAPPPTPGEGAGEVSLEPMSDAWIEARRAYQQAARARAVLSVWTVIYAVVGAQMGWILRPFIGTPGLPFTWFRERDSNFFEAVLEAFVQLFQ